MNELIIEEEVEL